MQMQILMFAAWVFLWHSDLSHAFCPSYASLAYSRRWPPTTNIRMTETTSTQTEEKKEWRRNEGSVGGSELGGGGGEREKGLGINVALHAYVEAAGCHPFDQQYRFKEIVHRQRYRWDLQLAVPHQDDWSTSEDAEGGKKEEKREEKELWALFCSAAMSAATPIIIAAHNSENQNQKEKNKTLSVEPLVIGAVISRPGAQVQRFHCDVAQHHFAAARSDATYRLYNLFIPLVDLCENGHGTEFWPAAQLDDSLRTLANHFLALETGAFASPLNPCAIQAPACIAGGMIIFDYRTIHRGLENHQVGGRERPIAYVTCATGGAREKYDFPEWSVENVDREIVNGFPFFEQLQGCCGQDSLDYYTEITGGL